MDAELDARLKAIEKSQYAMEETLYEINPMGKQHVSSLALFMCYVLATMLLGSAIAWSNKYELATAQSLEKGALGLFNFVEGKIPDLLKLQQETITASQARNENVVKQFTESTARKLDKMTQSNVLLHDSNHATYISLNRRISNMDTLLRLAHPETAHGLDLSDRIRDIEKALDSIQDVR